MRVFTLLCFGLPLSLATLGCGGDSGSGAENGGGDHAGTITEAWRDYCVATFTEDYAVQEFGETLFTARAGEEYLIADLGSGGAPATLHYLTSSGPYVFEVDAGASGVPFTTRCDAASAQYYAVFADVSVYDSETLSNKLCDLTAGTAVPTDPSSMTGYSATGSFSFTGPTIYEVSLNALGAQCGGAATGFVNVPEIEVLGTHTWLVPIETVLGP